MNGLSVFRTNGKTGLKQDKKLTMGLNELREVTVIVMALA